MNPFRLFLRWPASLLVRFGLLKRERADRIVNLSWPRMVTGFARISKEVADFAMIGTAVGPTALAGMAYAASYWMVGNTLSLGLSGGTISQVSKEYGADATDEIDLVVKQSVWIAVALGGTFAVTYVLFAEPLIGLLSDNPAALGFGTTYLQVMAVGLVFEFVNKVLSRTMVGADDAVTPMLVRGTGAVLNIVFNVVFIFGLGLGVLGAGLGTVLATVFVTVAFGVVLLTESGTAAFSIPFRLSLAPPYLDADRVRSLVSLSVPLMLRNLARTLAVFPLLAMASVFGPVVVAGYEAARRLRRLFAAPSWGFSLAASSLVGQELGAENRAGALAFSWDVIRLALFVHVLTAALVFLFARPLGTLFVKQPSDLVRVLPLIQLAAVSVVGIGLDGVTTGIFRGSGETRWPFYAKFAALYLVTLPVVYLGTVTSLGIYGLYLGLVTETTVGGLVLTARFLTRGPGGNAGG